MNKNVVAIFIAELIYNYGYTINFIEIDYLDTIC